MSLGEFFKFSSPGSCGEFLRTFWIPARFVCTAYERFTLHVKQAHSRASQLQNPDVLEPIGFMDGIMQKGLKSLEVLMDV